MQDFCRENIEKQGKSDIKTFNVTRLTCCKQVNYKQSDIEHNFFKTFLLPLAPCPMHLAPCP